MITRKYQDGDGFQQFGTICAAWVSSLSHVRPWDAQTVTRSKHKVEAKNGKKSKAEAAVPFEEDATKNGVAVVAEAGESETAGKVKKEYDQNVGDDAIDDPVRMYLMQMGEIPLLTRDEEVASAKEIERTRTKFRDSMLATDFILQSAVVALEKVRDGELRLDRTIEVSVTNTAEKKRIMSRIVPNVETLRKMLVLNHIDFRTAIKKTNSMKERQTAWRQLQRRRRRAVRLVEELNLRSQRILSLIHISEPTRLESKSRLPSCA